MQPYDGSMYNRCVEPVPHLYATARLTNLACIASELAPFRKRPIFLRLARLQLGRGTTGQQLVHPSPGELHAGSLAQSHSRASLLPPDSKCTRPSVRNLIECIGAIQDEALLNIGSTWMDLGNFERAAGKCTLRFVCARLLAGAFVRTQGVVLRCLCRFFRQGAGE